MATAFNNGTFSFNKEELKDWNKVIGERVYNHPALSELHDIETRIKHDTQIVFAGKLGLLSKQVAGCTPNEVDGITMSEKTWSPKPFDFRLSHCSADVNIQDKLVNQYTKMYPDFYNIFEGSQSNVGAYLVAVVENATIDDILWKAWFSDTAAATVTNGGVFKDGTDLDYINSINGFWKQILTEVPSGDSQHVEIAKNAGADYDAQELADGDAAKIFRKMHDAADLRLKSDADAMLLVSDTLFRNYQASLEDKQANGGIVEYLESGKQALEYRGMKVVNMGSVWDVFIKEYQDNGTKLNLPHRALLTVKSNIPLGTTSEDDFGEVDAFYDKVTKKNYVDGAFQLDAKFLEKYLAVAAY